MQIRFYGRDYDTTLDFENEIKLRDALVKSNILPSTIVVSFDNQILPLSTIIKNDIELLVTTVSSGG
jgi:sulfur carrier protein ThiS|tara:strand:- start:833 stop:1033 length:201 start_codon:yes stop_codon:yes gene_type:complete